jgi:NADPH:quinone reductase-like Zn-dependent oxidoreductase
MTDYMRDAQEVSWRGNEMLELVMSGALHVQINQVLALADAEQAHSIAEERATTGKLLLSAH